VLSLIHILCSSLQHVLSLLSFLWPDDGSSASVQLKLSWDRHSVCQPVSLSWSRAPIWNSWPDSFFLSDMCRFLHAGHPLWWVDGSVIYSYIQLLLGIARSITLRSKSCRTHNHILLSHLRFPQPGGPDPRIYIPPGTGWPSYMLGTGSYNSQGYGGGILTRLHTGNSVLWQLSDITSHHISHRKHHSQQLLYCCFTWLSLKSCRERHSCATVLWSLPM
jgi:hypothetical protein